jgi:hypothetical protein
VNFIRIKKSDWSNSVEIIIEQGFEFNILDLFFIFRFYFKNSNSFIRSIYLCVNTKEDNNTLFTYKKISHYGFENYKIDNFIKWLNDVLEKDKEYIIDSNFYGFKISFHEFSPILTSNKLIPNYPWEDPYFKELNHIKDLKYLDII